MVEAAEQNLDSLLERSNGTDVPLLLKAKEVAKRRVKDDPSTANLNALSRATQMLRNAMGDNQNFTAVKDVLAYLQDSGRKISRAQLYKDIGRGYLRKQKDGTIRRRDVDEYAKRLPVLALPEAVTDDMGELARREIEEKVEKTKAQRLSIEFDRKIKEGKYILRDDVTLELASRAAALDMNLRSVFRLYAPDYIRLVGGDPNKVEEFIAEFEKNLDTALSEYSRPMDFKVEYVPQETAANEAAAIDDADAEQSED